MAELKFLALDLGAESGRAVVGHLDGRALRLEEIHRFPNGPVRVNGHLHWDALRLYSEIKHGIGLAAKDLRARPSPAWASTPGASTLGCWTRRARCWATPTTIATAAPTG